MTIPTHLEPGAIVVDCPCGHPFRVTFTVDFGTTSHRPDGTLVTPVSVDMTGSDAAIEWHARRFHGSRSDNPLPVPLAA